MSEQTYPNAGPNCDLGRYRTGETPMVGDVVRMHAESVERVGSPAVQYAAMIGKDATVVDSTFTCEEGLDAAFAARFDLIRRADHSPDAGKMVEPVVNESLTPQQAPEPTLLENLKREVHLLRQIGRRQHEEIETLRGCADAVEVLRDIGKMIGCGHVDDPDGRRQLVNCVEQELNRLRVVADTCFLLEDDDPSQHGKPIACTQCWNALSEMQRESATKAARLSNAADEYQSLVDWVFRTESPMPQEKTTAHRIASLIQELRSKGGEANGD